LQNLDYCREVERYLCQKNDGHLIRVVGPSFELVSAWEARGVPLKVAFEGIDRYFERYYRDGRRRRRPVRIDFCEDDVLDAFDEWRRATGVVSIGEDGGEGRAPSRPTASLPSHLERVLTRLTAARATGAIDAAFDGVIDAVARELDRTRADSHRLRGAVRREIIASLASLDRQLMFQARSGLDAGLRRQLQREANEDIERFRASMEAEAFDRAQEAALDRLVRRRLGLPTIAY
jgi:hypothetical protein